MSIIAQSTERRVTVAMVAVLMLVFGGIALQQLKVNLLPDLSYPTLTVRTEYEGAAPVEMEKLVTQPIEEQVGVVRGVKVVKSVSRAGQSDVILEFAWGTDMDDAGLDVREKLELLQLPLEAKRARRSCWRRGAPTRSSAYRARSRRRACAPWQTVYDNGGQKH